MWNNVASYSPMISVASTDFELSQTYRFKRYFFIRVCLCFFSEMREEYEKFVTNEQICN